MNQNKVFQIELCKEDVERILLSLENHRTKCYAMIDECESEDDKDSAWLEWSYVTELHSMLQDKFSVNCW